MDLGAYDIIVLNSSAGKDSQAMLEHVYRLAKHQGVTSRLVVVHADLGRVEWRGTKELAEVQAKAYGLPFIVTRYTGAKGDLLNYVEQRGKWPDSQTRFCTSEYKRGPVLKVITHLVNKLGKPHARVLNCMGLRAQESPARAKRKELEPYKRATNSKRTVDNWHPILHWSVDEVWECIRQSGVPHHEAYDLGMPRLSCVFCVFAPRDALVIAGRANPELLNTYIETERKIGHTFRKEFPIARIADLIEEGYEPAPLQSWEM